MRHHAAVLAHQHERRTDHHFATVFSGRTGPQLSAEHNLPDVAHVHRHALTRAHDETPDVVERGQLSGRADEILLATSFDVSGANIGVVGRQRVEHVTERQAKCDQPLRVWCDVELASEPADAVHIGHARHGAQLRTDDPVLDRAQRHPLDHGVPCDRRIVFHRPQEDLTQSRGDGPHRGNDAGRQRCRGLLNPLVDQLPGEVDVRAVLEHHRHL